MWTKTLIVLAAAVLFCGNAFAATFTVQVRNLTKDAALAGYPVTVRAVGVGERGTTRQLGQVEARTDGSGTARGDIEAPPGSSLVADMVYRGVRYRSAPTAVVQPDMAVGMEVAVYEITDNRAGISIPSRQMVILIKDDRRLEIFETLTVENTGSSTYVGKFNNELDMNQVLHIPMPRGYMLTGFSGYDKPRLRTVSNGIITQNEIMPGTKVLNMHYYVQSDIGMFDLSLYTEKDAPETRMLTLFFPSDEAWDFRAPGHSPAGNQAIGGKTYTVWKGRPGALTRIEAYGPGYSGGFGIWHVAIVASFVIAGLFVYSSRSSLRSWRLAREEKRLKGLVGQMEAYSTSGGGFLARFSSTIEGRLKEIEEELAEEK